jgi:hypothetical protein
MDKSKTLRRILIIALYIAVIKINTVAGTGTVAAIIKPMVDTICGIYGLMYNVAGGLGALVITMAGFKWVGSAEDPGGRKQAKDTIVHALVGMLIIVIAAQIVGLITGTGADKICPTTTP